MSRRVRSRIAPLVGAAIRAAREVSGRTQVQLAEQAGIAQAYLSTIESGRAGTTPEMLARLANALECDPGSFLPTLERIRTDFGADLAGLEKR